VWANSKGSLLHVQHPATQIQLNDSCDRVLVWVEGISLCVTHREIWKSAKLHSIAQCFGHKGLVKTKFSDYFEKRAWAKFSTPF
jgi:hypothetical protein